MTNYANDNFVIKSNKKKATLVKDMKKSLEAITTWLKKSGLKVNDDKDKLCLFHCHYQGNVSVSVNGVTIQCKNNLNILRVIFDCKLNWNYQIANTTNKNIRALQHCVRQIKTILAW